MGMAIHRIHAALLLLATRAAALSPSLSLCAIGDLHGDAVHAMEALRLCEAVDAAGRWVGGALTVVQVGDVLDRGNASLPLVHRLWKLQEEASAAGGGMRRSIPNPNSATPLRDPSFPTGPPVARAQSC